MPITDASKLVAADELLMRQVHPNMMQEGRLWSGAFTPTKADKGLLSSDRDSVISPKDAYERYLRLKTLAQAGGTWGGEHRKVRGHRPLLLLRRLTY